MKKLTAITLCLLSLAAASATQLNVQLTRIASSFKTDFNAFNKMSAPVYHNGYYAFIGQGHGATSIGVFANLNGELTVYANKKTNIPSGAGKFQSFDLSPNSLSLKNDRLVFIGNGDFQQNGLYEVANKQINLLANQSTPVPHTQNNFTTFEKPSLFEDGGVGFLGADQDQHYSVYLITAQGLLQTLIDPTMNTPGEAKTQFNSITDIDFSKLSNSKHPIFAFIGASTNNIKGVYVHRSGHTRKIADTNTPLPSAQTGYFTQFSHVSYDSRTNGVALIASGLLAQTGIYYSNGNKLMLITDTQGFIPRGIGRFIHFLNLDAEDRLIVFHATGQNDQDGLYVYTSNGQIYKIIDNRDKIDGKTIKYFSISNECLYGQNLAFLVHFKDGNEGIYVATLNFVN